MEQRSWEHFDHDADIGLRVDSATRKGLFEAMAEALTAIITDPAAVQPIETITVRCEAPDDAMLLVDWLNALIFEMATRGMVFCSWQVDLDGQRLRRGSRARSSSGSGTGPWSKSKVQPTRHCRLRRTARGYGMANVLWMCDAWI